MIRFCIFSYSVLVEVIKFSIILIFTILLVFVMYFCRIYRKTISGNTLEETQYKTGKVSGRWLLLEKIISFKRLSINRSRFFFKLHLLYILHHFLCFNHMIKITTFRFFVSFRSSRPELFCEKGILRNFAKLAGKHLCQNLFF